MAWDASLAQMLSFFYFGFSFDQLLDFGEQLAGASPRSCGYYHWFFLLVGKSCDLCVSTGALFTTERQSGSEG